MKKLIVLGLLMVSAAETAVRADGARRKDGASFESLAYNRAGTCDRKGGLFSRPMVFDVNGDGRLDVVLASGGIRRHAGHWYFENTGRMENGLPVFKAGVRISKGGNSAQILPDGRLAVFEPGKVAYDWRANGMENAHAF